MPPPFIAFTHFLGHRIFNVDKSITVVSRKFGLFRCAVNGGKYKFISNFFYKSNVIRMRFRWLNLNLGRLFKEHICDLPKWLYRCT